MGIALDRTRDQCREVADKQRIVQRIFFHLAAPFEYVDGIAQRGQRKVAQPHRCQNAAAVGHYARKWRSCHNVRRHIPIFVIEQQSHAARNGSQQCQHPHGLTAHAANHQPAQPAQPRQAQQCPKQRAVARFIAKIADADCQQVIGAQHPGQGIVDHCHKGKKHQKGNRSNRQGTSFL